MAKHDRRKTSGQRASSRPVTIQVPLPVLGVVNGVREAFHGLCIATGLHVLEAMMEADRQVLCVDRPRNRTVPTTDHVPVVFVSCEWSMAAVARYKEEGRVRPATFYFEGPIQLRSRSHRLHWTGESGPQGSNSTPIQAYAVDWHDCP